MEKKQEFSIILPLILYFVIVFLVIFVAILSYNYDYVEISDARMLKDCDQYLSNMALGETKCCQIGWLDTNSSEKVPLNKCMTTS